MLDPLAILSFQSVFYLSPHHNADAIGDSVNAYNICRDVLAQIGEVVPPSVDRKQMAKMITTASDMVKGLTETKLLEMQELDEKLSTTLKFLHLLTAVSFFAKPGMFPYLTSRMVQLTMKNGLCQYSIPGLVQFAAMLCFNQASKDIDGASQIGKAAMLCSKNRRFRSAKQVPALVSGPGF